MTPLTTPLSVALTLALLPLAVVILAVFAVRERWTPVQSADRRA